MGAVLHGGERPLAGVYQAPPVMVRMGASGSRRFRYFTTTDTRQRGMTVAVTERIWMFFASSSS
jgi:hypothetical protein